MSENSPSLAGWWRIARIGESGSAIHFSNRATDDSMPPRGATPKPVPSESPNDKFIVSPFLCQLTRKAFRNPVETANGCSADGNLWSRRVSGPVFLDLSQQREFNAPEV